MNATFAKINKESSEEEAGEVGGGEGVREGVSASGGISPSSRATC